MTRSYGAKPRTQQQRNTDFVMWLTMASNVTRERALEQALKAGMKASEALPMIDDAMKRRQQIAGGR